MKIKPVITDRIHTKHTSFEIDLLQKKALAKRYSLLYNILRDGQLAQLVEHPLDVRKVRDSSSLASTIGSGACSLRLLNFFIYMVLRGAPGGDPARHRRQDCC